MKIFVVYFDLENCESKPVEKKLRQLELNLNKWNGLVSAFIPSITSWIVIFTTVCSIPPFARLFFSSAFLLSLDFSLWFFSVSMQNNNLSLSLSLSLALLLSLSLSEQQLEGDLEMLAVITYTCLCSSMLALLLTVLVLSCLQGLKSNTRSIHSNTAAAMLLSELVFLLGVNQTEQQVWTVLVGCVFSL